MRISLVVVFITLELTCAQLKNKAKKIYVGTAINSDGLANDAQYKKVAADNFNCLTAEWEMKWDPIESTRGQYNYTLGDKIVAFAQQNLMKVRGTTLMWHISYPKWVDALDKNKTELQKAMSNYLKQVATHYKGKVYSWVVANEVIEDNGKMRDTIWYRNFGTDFINQAFNLTYSIDPNAKLYINEYGVEGKNAKSDVYYTLVKKLKSEGVPIQGVGFQAHFEVGKLPTDIQSNLQRFADLGVEVAITELDIRIKSPASKADLEQQAKDYAYVYSACESVSQCVGVTVWGFTDKYSWIPDYFKVYGESNLFDKNYNPKPAVSAVEKVLH